MSQREIMYFLCESLRIYHTRIIFSCSGQTGPNIQIFKPHKTSYYPLLASRMRTRLLPRGFMICVDPYGTSFILYIKHTDGALKNT